MYEAAQLVNSRPIGRHPTDPNDGVYLAPNDLLLGRSSSSVPQGPFLKTANTTKQFHFLRQVVDSFWRKWTRDFFPSLIVRPKWHVEKRNVRKGDVVIVKDSNAMRGEWRLALVSEAYPSEDGYVRKVRLSYKNLSKEDSTSNYKGKNYTYIERPVHNIIVLIPIDEQQ